MQLSRFFKITGTIRLFEEKKKKNEGQSGPVCVQEYRTDLLHGHAATEDGCDGQVAAVARVTGSHHVLSVEHLLRQLGHRQRAVLLAAARCQRGESWHEEVQTRERNHVHGQFAQIGVQLAGEAQARGHAGHGGGH